MGYDESWFESQPVSDEFKCPICQEVFQNPQTLSQCEHIFCLACIQQCFQTNNNSNRANCPVCREPINKANLKPTIRAFRSLLDKLQIRCQFESCTEVIDLEHFEQHRLNCNKNPDNQPKTVPCPYRCGADISEQDSVDVHDCVSFLQNQILSLTIDKSQQELVIEKLTSEVDKLQQEVRQLRTNDSNEIRVPVSGRLLRSSRSSAREELIRSQLPPPLPLSLSPPEQQSQSEQPSPTSNNDDNWNSLNHELQNFLDRIGRI